jgi:hypothetical protein
MLRNIHGTNFFHIRFLDRTNIKCRNGLVLPPAQVFYFNGQVFFAFFFFYLFRITPLFGFWIVDFFDQEYRRKEKAK